MGSESTFRILLLTLTLIIYGVRVWHKAKVAAGNGMYDKPITLPTIAMTIWFLSLVGYGFGWKWLTYPLPISESIRWWGVAFMALSLPLSNWLWTYNKIEEYFTSRICGYVVPELIGDGPLLMMLHPMYATLSLCVLGTILLSANAIVLCTGIAALGVIAAFAKQEDAYRI